MKKYFGAAIVLMLSVLSLTACSTEKKTLKFADAGWDSNKFHNAVVGLIAESAFNYEWNEVSGSSTILHEGLLKGEIDVHTEVWTDNLTTYDADLKEGKLKEWGINYDDNIQGIYVPRYVIEGDAERGIEATAPNLKAVSDLANYKDLFPDDEDKSKGRLYGAIPGWDIDTVMFNKYLYYGLDKDYTYFRPGSDAAMSAAITSAYDKGIPIVCYYWEPTWLMGKYDFILLEDAPYVDEENYKSGKTACPSVVITTATSNGFAEKDPKFCEFLSHYKTSSALTSEALGYMQDTGADYTETAKWFLTMHDEFLDDWLPEEDAMAVRNYVSGKDTNKNAFFDFPFVLPMDITVVDNAVRGFSAKHIVFFDSIKDGLNNFISAIKNVLDIIPWWLLIIVVGIRSWKMSGKVLKGVLYAGMLFLVGLFGLWGLMYETLSIVIAAVIISLIIGLPLGILIAGSDRANNIFRPILDTMQTMPVFVYLIPAILFFGLGKAPAVVATVIYAVVPVIRLTSHGIRQVDAEVVEAAMAFGSTRFQALWKVQIPQALPTIMTGVNQTLMMAMAMVVTCSLIGASGLGMEVIIAVNRIEMGRGIIAGTAVVIVAILIDRLTQGLIKDNEVKDNGE